MSLRTDPLALLLDLGSLHGDAGSCESLDAFLELALARILEATAGRAGFLVFLADGDRHQAASPALGAALSAAWAGLPDPEVLFSGPFDAEALLEQLGSRLAPTPGLRTAPLHNSGELRGLLGVVEPDEAALPHAARAASVALGNFQLFREARGHLARQGFLREITGLFATEGTLGHKVSSLLLRLRLLRGVHGAAMVLDEGPPLGVGLDPEGLRRAVELAGNVTSRSGVRLVEGPDGRWAVAPLARREILGGVLVLFSRSPGAFRRGDRELLTSVSEAIALNLENARLLEQSQGQVQELSFVFRVSAALRREKTLVGLMNTILEQCARSIAADQGYLLFHEEPHLLPAASWGGWPPLLPEPLTLPEGMAEALRRLRCTDAPRQRFPELLSALALPSEIPTWLLLPLKSDQGLLGVLLLGRREGEVAESERRLLLTLANVAENAIGRAMAFEEMQARVREEASSRAKSEFLAIMSHELRTPLTAILGFAEVLLGEHFGPLVDKQREYLGDILQNGQHLLDLINDVLDLAKVEAGRMELAPEPVELGELLEELESSFRTMAERKGLELRIARPVLTLRADRRRLKQVLYNLLSNAVKFTEAPGDVELRVDPGPDHLRLSVRDTGVGIAREDLEAIFQPFTQGRRSAARHHEGTGLGLSLTRRLVELHRGRIWAESEPGAGSVFHVELPREEA